MAVSICLSLGSIKGESKVRKEEIDCLSWSWGLTQSASAHVASGASVGSADVRDVTITKLVDKSSPNIIKSCFAGDDHKQAVLTVMKVAGTGKPMIEMVKITMGGPDSTVFISSVQTGDLIPGTEQYQETVSLNFSKVKFEFTPQKADQTPDAAVGTGDLNIATKVA